MGIIDNAFGTMQMVDYPYPTDFLGSLPANPVKTACTKAQQAFPHPGQDMDFVNMLQIILNVFQNSTGTLTCTDVGSEMPRNANATSSDKDGALDSDGWDYQVCNEMVMPIAQNGKTDMFFP